MASSTDTIAAIATAPGRGSVAVIRVSGGDSGRVARAMLGKLPAPRRAHVGRFLDASGAPLDTGLALFFPAPASFTGEDVLELQGHGGQVVTDLVLRRVLELGCRLARPGEFSERAFANGKMDIAQAEAVADLIDAGTAAAARSAVRSMQGEFSAKVDALLAALTALRTYVEAAIDFPDEEIDFLAAPALRERMSRLFADVDAVAAAARQGVLLRDGLTVVIAGEPNAGKSSLLNRLAGEDVAIVTALPGTTRDVLRRQVQLDGMPLHLLDTAGLRDSADIVEAEGIRRARVEMARADVVLYVVDGAASDAKVTAASDPRLAAARDAAGSAASDPAGSAAARDASGIAAARNAAGSAASPSSIDTAGDWPPQASSAAPPGRTPERAAATLWLRVFNKRDLVPAETLELPVHAAGEETPLWVSARTGAGIDQLRARLKQLAEFTEAPEGSFAARRRHVEAIGRARACLVNADRVLQARSFELFAEELRLAQDALGEITGRVTSEELLGRIFGSFCVGK